MEAQARLVESHIWLAWAIAWRYRDHGLPVEDLVQEGNLLLVHLLDRPMPPNFTAYASRAIRTHVAGLLACSTGAVDVPERLAYGKVAARPTFVALPRDNESGALADAGPELSEDERQAPRRAAFRRAWMEALTHNEREVLGLRYGSLLQLHAGIARWSVQSSRGIGEVMKRLGKSKANVVSTTRYALRKLERALSEGVLPDHGPRGVAALPPTERREQARRAGRAGGRARAAKRLSLEGATA